MQQSFSLIASITFISLAPVGPTPILSTTTIERGPPSPFLAK